MGTPDAGRDQGGQLEDLEQMWKDFGHYLTDLRSLERGIDRRKLADQAKVAYQTIVTLEQGGRHYRGEWALPNPKDEVLAAVAGVLGVPVADLFSRVGRYSDRAQTKSSRRGTAIRPPGGDRDDEILKLLRDMDERLKRLEERSGGAQEQPRPSNRRRRPAG
jgi:transcriptional regulator with XRE-family HTH domain